MKRAIAWEITSSGSPNRLSPALIDFERSLEDWVESDITIVADDVLSIGRQVPTRFTTYLDLLGIDGKGDAVIIELKRHQTLRETVAQGLEYAAWVDGLGRDEFLH